MYKRIHIVLQNCVNDLAYIGYLRFSQHYMKALANNTQVICKKMVAHYTYYLQHPNFTF